MVIQDATYGQGSPLVLVVPLTSQVGALRFPGTVRIEPTGGNGLTLSSIAMVFQMRALDRTRFVSRLGILDAVNLDLVLAELDRLIGRQPQP